MLSIETFAHIHHSIDIIHLSASLCPRCVTFTVLLLCFKPFMKLTAYKLLTFVAVVMDMDQITWLVPQTASNTNDQIKLMVYVLYTRSIMLNRLLMQLFIKSSFRAEHLHHSLPVRSETRSAKVWRQEAVLWYTCGGSTPGGKWSGFFWFFRRVHSVALHWAERALMIFLVNKHLFHQQVSQLRRLRWWLTSWWGWLTLTWMSSMMTWSPKCSRWDCVYLCFLSLYHSEAQSLY